MNLRKALGFSYLNAARAIPESITPWLPHIDYVIAIDGSYKTPLPPDFTPPPDYSTDDSYEVLQQVCGKKLVYAKYSGPQIDKRQRYLDIAGELKCDMLIVWDSDDYLHPDPKYQDWPLFNAYLKIIAHEEPDPSIHFMWAWIPDETIWAKQYNSVPSNTWQKYARIHNKPGEQQYILNHHTWTTKAKLKEIGLDTIGYEYMTHRNKKGHPHLIFADPDNVVDGVRFTTHRNHRTLEQREHGDLWALNNAREEEVGLLQFYRKKAGLELLPLHKPHYYDETGKLVFY